MTREELNSWNICKERPDAIVFKDVIFDHFESQLKAKDEQIQKMKNCHNCQKHLSESVDCDIHCRGIKTNYSKWECRE